MPKRTAVYFDVYKIGGAKAAHLIALRARDAAEAIERACRELSIGAGDKGRLIARSRN
jgi:hypothetical protein